MNKILLVFLWVVSILLALGGGWWFAKHEKEVALKAPSVAEKIRKYDKYSYEALSARHFEPSPITIEETLKETSQFTSYLFSFQTEGKKVTGQLNVPRGGVPTGGFPTILMIRGWAEAEGYKTGSGTRHVAEYFAKNGFLTVAPDFLGYGGSEARSEDELEARFQTYTTALTLLNSLQNVKQADPNNIFLWGHSNGGHIALALLEITSRPNPTSLWAPVSKPFPYSILAYSDDSPDKGRALRKILADFEQDYDVDKYSLDMYLDRINAPIQLAQGTADKDVPKWWSDQFIKTLKEKKKEVTYNVYPGADHNLTPSWNQAAAASLSFYKKHLK